MAEEVASHFIVSHKAWGRICIWLIMVDSDFGKKIIDPFITYSNLQSNYLLASSLLLKMSCYFSFSLLDENGLDITHERPDSVYWKETSMHSPG